MPTQASGISRLITGKPSLRWLRGQYLNKNVADCVRDDITARRLTYQGRQLDALGDHLLAYHRSMVSKAKMQKEVCVGELPFRWQPECEFFLVRLLAAEQADAL